MWSKRSIEVGLDGSKIVQVLGNFILEVAGVNFAFSATEPAA
jgi:hypothetical protein